ncbi:MAG: hypothetical protein JNL97_06210 [Verrucomicrobiales bacterium]|nr:hypothetical protein [Verrucomicrobiales bacterium]
MRRSTILHRRRLGFHDAGGYWAASRGYDPMRFGSRSRRAGEFRPGRRIRGDGRPATRFPAGRPAASGARPGAQGGRVDAWRLGWLRLLGRFFLAKP